MRPVTRRRFLLGAGSVAVALPFLESTARLARGGDPPKIKRFIGLYSPNGMLPSAWATTGSGTSFTLGETLQPLVPHQDQLIVLRGVDLLSASGLVDQHREGLSGMLTGAFLERAYNGPDGGFGNDISIDQVIANQYGTATPIHSLQLGSDPTADDPDSCLTYLGPNQAPPKENNPVKLFQRLFGDTGMDQQAASKKATHRRSILDSVLRDYDDLHAKVSADDRHRLDAHLSAIRDVESRLAIVATCSPPAVSQIPIGALRDEPLDLYPERRRAMFDLLALALSCDLTRVATFLHEGAGGRAELHPFLGFSDEHHLLSHAPDTPSAETAKLKVVDRWFMEGTAYLLERLKALADGAGTLMDNTLVFQGSDLSLGSEHSHTNMPYLLIGSAGGYFQTGRVLDCGGASHNNLLVSILNAFDVNVSTFGNPSYCSGPLAGLH